MSSSDHPYREREPAPAADARVERTGRDAFGVVVHIIVFIGALVRMGWACIYGLDFVGFIAVVVVCLSVLGFAERRGRRKES